MKLYLVQHAEPKRKEEDPSRPLSNKGWKDIKKMAEYAKDHLHINIEQIVHSGKLRAKQTAEVLAEYLTPKEVMIDENLAPLADPRVWQKNLAKRLKDIMLVGHLPHLGKLASILLIDYENKEVITFRMSCIVCIEREQESHWTILWMITPEIIS